MSEDYSAEKEAIREKFERLADSYILDPDFEFEVTAVEVFERQSITGTASSVAFSIEVETNNRAQLLGQMDPYDIGGHSGYLENLYRGHIVEEVKRELELDYGFTVEINAIPADPSMEYLDRYLSLPEAIDEGLVPEDSPLAETMRKYDLENIVLAGGSAIMGPSPGGIETMEQIHESREVETVLDLFSGSGAYSKVAVEYGAEHVDAIDIDAEPTRANVGDVPEVNVREMDALEFSPDRDYDLVVADPNYDLAKRFIEEQVPELVDYCEYYVQNVAFVGHTYWRETITAKLEPHFETLTEYDTGRMHQVLGRT